VKKLGTDGRQQTDPAFLNGPTIRKGVDHVNAKKPGIGVCRVLNNMGHPHESASGKGHASKTAW
jgi:hypothetical protein